MSKKLDPKQLISELLIAKKLDKTSFDKATIKTLEHFKDLLQTHEDEDNIKQEMGEALSKKVQNPYYKELLSTLDFKFDDLSKTSKDTIQTISQITTELRVRAPSEDLILSEIISLENQDEDLKETLKALKEKNEFYRLIEENLDEMLESSTRHLLQLESQEKESEEYAKSIGDRIADILEPKSAEYSAQINALHKKGVDYPLDKENTYERVEFLHKKMLTLEHSLEDVMQDYGDIGSIPTSYEEALQILERKKAKALELEQRLNLM